MTIRRIARFFALALAVILTGSLPLLRWMLTHFKEPSVDPARALSASIERSRRAVTVRYSGTSTPLFSDRVTHWMVDGWFSRFGPLDVLFSEMGPDVNAVARGLENNQIEDSAVVIPTHSHFDHAMDAPEVARRTGAVLLGSESTANIARGWGLSEDQIRVAVSGESIHCGDFTIALIDTQHFAFPNPALAKQALSDPMITAPLTGPFTGPVWASSLANRSGTKQTLKFLKQKEASHSEIRFSTLPRFDEVVPFQAPGVQPQ